MTVQVPFSKMAAACKVEIWLLASGTGLLSYLTADTARGTSSLQSPSLGGGENGSPLMELIIDMEGYKSNLTHFNSSRAWSKTD